VSWSNVPESARTLAHKAARRWPDGARERALTWLRREKNRPSLACEKYAAAVRSRVEAAYRGNDEEDGNEFCSEAAQESFGGFGGDRQCGWVRVELARLSAQPESIDIGGAD